MNRADIVARVSEATGLPKATAEVAVTNIFKAVTDALTSGDSVAIAGFGNFSVKARDARKGRNPQTGAEIDIPASKVPGFKAAKALKDAVNA
jgi:DNA-binding protein HU-beta